MSDPQIQYRFHAAKPDESDEDPMLILVSDRDSVVLPTGSGARFPTLDELTSRPGAQVILQCAPWHEIGIWQGRPVYALEVDSEDLGLIAGNGELKQESYRSLYLKIVEAELGLFGRAIQIVDWYLTTRCCPVCGTPTNVPELEPVARCPACGHDQYPRLAPAMIVAVIRDGQLLLARSSRFRGGVHSVLAGFVEPGESVEECVRREVFEETHIQIKNLRYFGSQSWPFPHSLMLGFTAEWACGALQIDEDEVVHAGWYPADDLPEVPSEISISGRLIAWFRKNYA